MRWTLKLVVFEINSKLDQHLKCSGLSADHHEILRTPRQCNCRDVYKSPLRSVQHILNYITPNCDGISNSIEIPLEGYTLGKMTNDGRVYWRICASLDLIELTYLAILLDTFYMLKMRWTLKSKVWKWSVKIIDILGILLKKKSFGIT